MIRRVRLQNWRAYRQLDLAIHPGVTFLVAANGIGKSSLLEAVRCTVSTSTAIDPAVIRHGHDEASVTVNFVSEQDELEVRRSVRMQGSRCTSSFHAVLNGRELGEASYRRLLTQLWSADLAFVSKTAFLTEDLRAETEPDLRAHLCHVYSLDELQRALGDIAPALSRANRAVRAARAESTATAEQLSTAKQERNALDEQLAAARSAMSAARDRHGLAQRNAEQVLAAQRLRAAATAWDERHAALLHAVQQVAGSPSDQRALPDALRQARLSVSREIEVSRNEQAQLRARLDSLEELLANLHAAGGQCPVCLRELDDQTRQHAEHLHSEGLARLHEQLQRHDPQPIAERLSAIERLELQVAAMGERPATPDMGHLDAAYADVALTQADLERTAGAVREVELAARRADEHIGRITAELAEAEQLTRLYREVALLEAAEKALNRTISSVLGDQLAPLAAEVNRRWQVVFPDRRNLMLTPDGTMSRDAGGTPLAFSSFSAGEKMVAQLTMRLTTLLATTKVPFCWVDEPLEHLDPRNRHLVGSMLAHLSGAPGLEQIFVTTYEEPLARRLAEFQPEDVRVEYLRAEHVS